MTSANQLHFAGFQFARDDEYRVSSARYQAGQRQSLAAIGASGAATPGRPAAPRTLSGGAGGGWGVVEPPRPAAKKSKPSGDPAALSAVAPVRIPPARATPVFADGLGNTFIAQPTTDGITAIPFTPRGSAPFAPGKFADGGFLPAKTASAPSRPTATESMIKNAVSQLPRKVAEDWLTSAAADLMKSGLPGSSMGGALDMLTNGGCFGKGTDLLSSLADSLGQTIAGQIGGMVPSIGSMIGGDVGKFIDGIGLGNLPGELVQEALGELFAGPGEALSKLADQIGDLSGGNLPDVAGMVKGLDFSAIVAEGLNKLAGHLMSQWKVDDESSAAEHIAHHMVSKYQADMLSALGDLDAFFESMREFFGGAISEAVEHAARIGDPDKTKPHLVATGLPEVLAEGIAIARVGDLMSPAQKPITAGAPLVLSGGLPTARRNSPTAVPGAIEIGAVTVLVGDGPKKKKPSGASQPANTQGNPPPASPNAPAGPPSSGASQDSGPFSAGEDDSLLESMLRKIWNAPNTALGLAYGGVGHLLGEAAHGLGLSPDYSRRGE